MRWTYPSTTQPVYAQHTCLPSILPDQLHPHEKSHCSLHTNSSSLRIALTSLHSLRPQLHTAQGQVLLFLWSPFASHPLRPSHCSNRTFTRKTRRIWAMCSSPPHAHHLTKSYSDGIWGLSTGCGRMRARLVLSIRLCMKSSNRRGVGLSRLLRLHGHDLLLIFLLAFIIGTLILYFTLALLLWETIKSTCVWLAFLLHIYFSLASLNVVFFFFFWVGRKSEHKHR